MSGPDPATVTNDELVLGVCGPEHRAEQARLFDACFKKGATAEDLAWRYDRCPHGSAVSLVSRPPGGEGISGYACSPRLALARGDEATMTPVGETGDVMTHPAWRKRGIFSGLDRRAMEETAARGWALAFGLPNRHSAHIFLELGWERIGVVRPYSYPLRATPMRGPARNTVPLNRRSANNRNQRPLISSERAPTRPTYAERRTPDIGGRGLLYTLAQRPKPLRSSSVFARKKPNFR